jgi:DNA-binding HxlR family transcriptional regulator
MTKRQNIGGTTLEISEIEFAYLAFELLQGKWRLQILCIVRSGPIRLGQLGKGDSQSVQE